MNSQINICCEVSDQISVKSKESILREYYLRTALFIEMLKAAVTLTYRVIFIYFHFVISLLSDSIEPIIFRYGVNNHI